jgi:hypothetical protein
MAAVLPVASANAELAAGAAIAAGTGAEAGEAGLVGALGAAGEREGAVCGVRLATCIGGGTTASIAGAAGAGAA